MNSMLNYDARTTSSPVYIPSMNNLNGMNNGPTTPGPRTIEAIQNDARERFAGIVWIQKEPSYQLEDYFLEYDYWEVYSETKWYSKRIYSAAYKGVMRDYNNFLCILNGEQGEEYYVVAKRIRNELESLEPYCTCFSCSAVFLNPLKYIWCPYCTKCIKAGIGFANAKYIEKARVLKAGKEQRKQVPVSKYRKYWENISWIKISEVTVTAAVIIAAISIYFA